jgi:uncharacterized membrane protein (UPF0182 family)
MYPSLPEPSRRTGRLVVLIVGLFALLTLARAAASFIIEYQWWKEMGQVSTWIELLIYGISPAAVATLAAFLVLWLAHARALKFAGTSLGGHRLYALLSSLALLGISWVLASATIDTWTVVRFFGGRGLAAVASEWHDSIFGLPLRFYLFDLPFYSGLLRFLLALVVLSAILYWIAARGWQLARRFPEMQAAGEFDPQIFRLEGALESRFLRFVAAALLLALAVQFFLGRYEMLWQNHGFMVGVDYVAEKITLPLQWLLIFACLGASVLVSMGRWRMVVWMGLAVVVRGVVPPIVSAVYVKPNEITLQRPYIQTHIRATRSAFGLEKRTTETEFKAKLESRIDVAANKPIFDNIRLWDWRAFHDTITQIQALRSYYVFADTDVDRYTIDGNMRQVLLTPRELDVRQLPAGQTGWINPRFVYTHGFGLVMAEANRISTDGMPVLFVNDAPPKISTPSLQLTRPEIYYGEIVQEPVFVHTAQREFNYPSGADNVFSTYEGKGGFPVDSFPLRLAAAIREGDANILLTGYMTSQSKMMIRRKVRDRLSTLANFISWETDPYLVLTDEGRLVWIVDGYTTSTAHPYASSIALGDIGDVNYIRNAVKATVDAYDGTANIYIFDPADPIIQAYQQIFPGLLRPASQMPAGLRAHTRYPEIYFRAQAEIYRAFHMQDPQAFYNKEDLWDIARNVQGQDNRPQPVTPTYVVATLPGETKAEFLLVMPFTPRSKDNMIGLMVARCDGEHLGELVFLQLSKQALIFGPMQIEARINQDQNISKDLTLWNQQGSQVLRGQMLVLPVGDTFLYVEPLYIQASEARMPQLKKVVLAMGNTLIYRDTYDQALAELTGIEAPAGAAAPSATPSAAAPKPASPAGQEQLERIREHLRRYRELTGQGRWSEAGKELEAIETEVQRR